MLLREIKERGGERTEFKPRDLLNTALFVMSENSAAALGELPLDPLLHIASMLDGRSLAACCECSSKSLAQATEVHLGAFWEELRRALPATSPAAAHSGCPKSEYVHAWAEAQGRCPRCGKQSPQHTGSPEDGYDERQAHLCHWFSGGGTSRRRSPLVDRTGNDALPSASAPSSQAAPPPQQQTLARWLVPVERWPAAAPPPAPPAVEAMALD